ncbi:MAG: hypothetical protein KAU02_01385 [Tenericutes bacterium]|nr:hypothetical protein [Mycoplasmatota bacterium]
MDKYVNSEANQHVMKLLLAGAKVQVVSGKMVYVKFLLENNFQVSYVYHINKKNKYFLERIKPYPLAIKEFSSADEVIDIIEMDYHQYKNAVQSKKINEFVNINKEFHQVMKSFEDLFLYYNIPTETINSIKDNIDKTKALITKATKSSNRVFFEKDPDNL